MRRVQNLLMWLDMPSSATCRLGSPRKKLPMSFAIWTMCSGPSLIWISPCLLRDGHFRGFQQTLLSLGEIAKTLLPLGRLADTGRLYGCDLVLGAIRRPVRVVRR